MPSQLLVTSPYPLPDESNLSSHVSTTLRSFKVFLPISRPMPCMHIPFSTHSHNFLFESFIPLIDMFIERMFFVLAICNKQYSSMSHLRSHQTILYPCYVDTPFCINLQRCILLLSTPKHLHRFDKSRNTGLDKLVTPSYTKCWP